MIVAASVDPISSAWVHKLGPHCILSRPYSIPLAVMCSITCFFSKQEAILNSTFRTYSVLIESSVLTSCVQLTRFVRIELACAMVCSLQPRGTTFESLHLIYNAAQSNT